MKYLTVKDLKAARVGVDDRAFVVWQANEPGEEDEGTEEATHTFAMGTVFSAWVREPELIVKDAGCGSEFVIDGAVTECE